MAIKRIESLCSYKLLLTAFQLTLKSVIYGDCWQLIPADVRILDKIFSGDHKILRVYTYSKMKIKWGWPNFFRMFESRPELMEVFSKFKGRDLHELRRAGLLRQHALRVMATIDKAITRLDEPSSLIILLREVGAHHKLYKVPPENLQVVTLISLYLNQCSFGFWSSLTWTKITNYQLKTYLHCSLTI